MANRYGLQIRAAAPEDASDLALVLASVGRPVAAAALAARLDALRTGAGAVLVAVEWGPPSGLVAASWFPVIDGDLPVAQVNTLLVAPDSRRRGIGRLLLKAVAQAARLAGCGDLRVAVPPGEDGLSAFCDATGFVRAGAVFTRPLRKRG